MMTKADAPVLPVKAEDLATVERADEEAVAIVTAPALGRKRFSLVHLY